MRLVKKGAEAELYKTKYLGRTVLIKKRVRKKYRERQLDERIRKERIRAECQLLHKAKAIGVRTPVIYKVDMDETAIFMELVQGKILRDVLNKKNLFLCREIGKEIAKLHKNNIIHGDLTTDNMLLNRKGLVFLDFGLGFNSAKIEDKAVDLLVFKKTFQATHFKLLRGWNLVIEGYLKEFSKGSGIVSRISEVEKRARYI